MEWARTRGIFEIDANGRCRRGLNWGNPRIFCESEEEFDSLRKQLPAAYGWENAGPRPANAVSREMRLNLAVAREAIYAELNADKLGAASFRQLTTRAEDKASHLCNPELGAQLSPASLGVLAPEPCAVQILIADGLSAEAIHHNIPAMLPGLIDRLAEKNIQVGQPLLVPNGRVKLSEPICEALDARIVVTLIGERPGGDGLASRSMSAYLAYRVEGGDETRDGSGDNSPDKFEYTVISNIYDKGITPENAAEAIADTIGLILKHRAAGNRLTRLRDAPTNKDAGPQTAGLPSG